MPKAYHGHCVEALEAWVVFQPAAAPGFWRACTGSAYAHCWMFWSWQHPDPALTALRWTTKLEQTPTGLHVDTWPAEPEEVAATFAPQVGEIIRLRRRVRHDQTRLRGLITCVTLIKARLGLDCPLVISPRQLRDYLLQRCGGTIVEA